MKATKALISSSMSVSWYCVIHGILGTFTSFVIKIECKLKVISREINVI